MVIWLSVDKMFRVMLVFATSITPFFMAAQNLVPNPSFEDTLFCPYAMGGGCPNPNLGSFDAIPNWQNPVCTSSDVYNACAPAGGIGVPSNLIGFQYANTGYGYVGLYSNLGFLPPGFNEYVSSPLTQALVAGRKYIVGFYISFTRDNFNPTLWNGSNAIGALLTIGTPDTTGSGQNQKINATAQVNNPPGNILNDTVNWVLISDTIVAAGGENYITIGNFTPDSLEQGDGAYFFVDDVSVVEYVEPPSSLYVPTAFSPNGDNNNDILFVRGNNIASIDFHVFDRWGQEVFKSQIQTDGWDGTFKGSKLNHAVFMYYCTITYTDGKTEVVKGNVTLVR